MAIKKNEVVIHVTVWMDHGNIMLSEGSQIQKPAYYMTPFIRNMQNKEIYRDSGCLALAVWEEQDLRSVIAKGYGISFWSVLWLHNSMRILQAIELYTLDGWIIFQYSCSF